VACFYRAKHDRQRTTIYHDSTTNSPSKNHILPRVFAKIPSKNAQIARVKINGPIGILSGLRGENRVL
jgi:hypothetical protein